MKIADFTFYVIDQNLQRRNALARLLNNYARAVPFDKVSEVGSVTADKPCFLVYDEGDQLQACLGETIVQDTIAAVFAYSAQPKLERVFEILDKGAGGYFDYDGGDADPSGAIKQLLHRNAKRVALRRRRQVATRRLQALSQREQEVLRAVSDGQSNKAIARHLSVSPRTIEVHRRNMIAKLEVPCTISAVRLALEAEL
ncbi:response regulator transcription factor [Qipengyuania qiaonensis]|uniref:LuxR C-terminal-related transcriptional regulator n=1 Tax=Qipengyuania qiaonensis TaxID=2867240 RepID=A0ABS7J8A8_9SPHN|nr:LuxR C-terminal-related transcriptional regulator [Qipengyuania qiaonensis]MBX7481888.1 LuxR C-terminal-related transcriptional regulator [Qipengyuania qiaonensis]